MATSRGKGPSAESLREQYDHSYDHRGDSGMFGHFFTEDVDEWSPADGENEIAIVPYFIEENSIFRKTNPDFNLPLSEKALKSGGGWMYKLTVLVHGNVGPNKDRVICPRVVKMPCPICELRDELGLELGQLKAKGRTDKELEDRIMQLRAAKRAIYNMISFNSRKDRERGVVVWAAPHASIQDAIIDRAKDKRTGEYKSFAVLSENWNVCFEKTGKGLNTEYSSVDVLDRRKEDRLSEEEVDRILERAYVLDSIVEIKPYDDLYEMLHGAPSDKAKDEPDRAAAPRPEEEDSPRPRRGREETPAPREERAREPRDREPRGGRVDERPRGERSGGEPDDTRPPAPERKSTRDTESVGAEDRPECFTLEFMQRSECDECPTDTFKACMKDSDEKARSKRPERGGEERESGRPARGGKR